MKKKVLIFDDDADILEVCTILLEDNGFEAYTQNNCEDVLQKLDHVLPDVVLMDNKIPPNGLLRKTCTPDAA
jgi:two-component system cell cycle response regulator DivK